MKYEDNKPDYAGGWTIAFFMGGIGAIGGCIVTHSLIPGALIFGFGFMMLGFYIGVKRT